MSKKEYKSKSFPLFPEVDARKRMSGGIKEIITQILSKKVLC
jgi:hypothetical protein